MSAWPDRERSTPRREAAVKGMIELGYTWQNGQWRSTHARTALVAHLEGQIGILRRQLHSKQQPVTWLPILGAPRDGRRLMLWDSVSKRPVFGSWRGDNPAITHYAAEPAGPAAA